MTLASSANPASSADLPFAIPLQLQDLLDHGIKPLEVVFTTYKLTDMATPFTLADIGYPSVKPVRVGLLRREVVMLGRFRVESESEGPFVQITPFLWPVDSNSAAKLEEKSIAEIKWYLGLLLAITDPSKRVRGTYIHVGYCTTDEGRRLIYDIQTPRVSSAAPAPVVNHSRSIKDYWFFGVGALFPLVFGGVTIASLMATIFVLIAGCVSYVLAANPPSPSPVVASLGLVKVELTKNMRLVMQMFVTEALQRVLSAHVGDDMEARAEIVNFGDELRQTRGGWKRLEE